MALPRASKSDRDAMARWSGNGRARTWRPNRGRVSKTSGGAVEDDARVELNRGPLPRCWQGCEGHVEKKNRLMGPTSQRNKQKWLGSVWMSGLGQTKWSKSEHFDGPIEFGRSWSRWSFGWSERPNRFGRFDRDLATAASTELRRRRRASLSRPLGDLQWMLISSSPPLFHYWLTCIDALMKFPLPIVPLSGC